MYTHPLPFSITPWPTPNRCHPVPPRAPRRHNRHNTAYYVGAGRGWAWAGLGRPLRGFRQGSVPTPSTRPRARHGEHPEQSQTSPQRRRHFPGIGRKRRDCVGKDVAVTRLCLNYGDHQSNFTGNKYCASFVNQHVSSHVRNSSLSYAYLYVDTRRKVQKD